MIEDMTALEELLAIEKALPFGYKIDSFSHKITEHFSVRFTLRISREINPFLMFAGAPQEGKGAPAMTSEDSKNLTETRRAILKRKYGHLYLEEELVNDWFTWENPDDPVPVFDGAGSYIEDTARALALVDKYIRGMGGRIQVESDAIIHAPSMGYDAEVTLKMGFHPPSLHEYLARSEAQGSDKA